MENCRFQTSILMVQKVYKGTLIRWEKCGELDLFAIKSV